jgi:RNA-binding protein
MISQQKKLQLRGQAHALKPVVLLGQHGYTPAVAAEINQALTDHELIKIKLPSDDRQWRIETAQAICTELQAELIQTIGKTVVLYRKRPEASK